MEIFILVALAIGYGIGKMHESKKMRKIAGVKTRDDLELKLKEIAK